MTRFADPRFAVGFVVGVVATVLGLLAAEEVTYRRRWTWSPR